MNLVFTGSVGGVLAGLGLLGVSCAWWWRRGKGCCLAEDCAWLCLDAYLFYLKFVVA